MRQPLSLGPGDGSGPIFLSRGTLFNMVGVPWNSPHLWLLKSQDTCLLGLPLCRAASGGGPLPPEVHRHLPFSVSHTHLMLKQKAYTEKSVSRWNKPQADPKATLDSCLFFFFRLVKVSAVADTLLCS